MDTIRIEIEDIRTESIVGWIEYENGEFFASDDEFQSMITFYRENGADDGYIIDALSNWSNGIYRGYVA